jgi:SAM-dependent methyltransferase
MLESFAIERLARAHGWWVQRQNGGFLQVFFLQPGGGWRNVDIFTMFVEPSVELGVGRIYGLNDTATPAGRDAVVPLSSITLEGRAFPAPAKVDVFMQAAYGPTWRVPDPNFSYGMTPGKRQMKDWFSGYRADRDRWTRVYRYQPEIVPREPTQFAHWAREQVGDVDTVVDVGCGMGRDTFLYAASLPHAVGLDAAGSGVRRATRRGRRSGSAAEFRQVNLCSLRGTAVAGALLARDYPGRRAVTANHLLDAVSPSGVPHFWALCAMLLRGGGRLVAEFSAAQHDGEFVQFPGMTRRVVSPEQVAVAAAERGGSVLHSRMTVTEEGESWQMVIEWP